MIQSAIQCCQELCVVENGENNFWRKSMKIQFKVIETDLISY